MKLTFACTALLVSQISLAFTPINGGYANVFGGRHILSGNLNRSFAKDHYNNSQYKGGYNGGASLGFKDNPMRYELELSYFKTYMEKLKVNHMMSDHIDGYHQGLLTFLNAYYDFPELIPTIQPYLGFGVGYTFLETKLGAMVNTESYNLHIKNDVFAYQGMSGLTYNFAENYALSLGYRYVLATTTTKLGKNFKANMVNLGITYRFDEEKYK
ncbi:MAG: outer membrane protein [Legionella sp.]